MANEEVWYAVFGPGHPDLQKQHRFHKRLPSPPRCKLCLAPFGGLGGAYMRFRGKRPSNRNPRFCSACDHFIRAHPGGAEVMLSLVFADVRGSTALAEQVSPTELHRRINAFYAVVTHELVETDGFMIDVVGDEVVGVYPPGMSGEHHAALAIEAARRLVALGPDEAGGLEFGVGVHTGLAHEMQGSGDRPEATFVALAGDEVVGYAKFALTAAMPTSAFHDISGVKRAWRGRGIARALKVAQIRWASENGYTELRTRNAEQNEPIRRLNASLGYTPGIGRRFLVGPVARA